MTIDGYEEINKLVSDEYVLTYNYEKQENEYKKVKRLFIINNPKEELYTIKTSDMELDLTSQHHVYTMRNNEYTYIVARELEIGDIVRYPDGQIKKIIEINHKPLTEIVYNIETEDNHNFYVGEKGILVHNASVNDDTFTSRGGNDGN